MENKSIYEEILYLVYDAIDSEVGEKREYSIATEQYIDMISKRLISALDLPPDFSL